MLSQFYILSPRGDIIINRDFRGDLAKGTNEIFLRHVKLYKGDAPPVFNIDGINYFYTKRSNLYLMATCRYNISASFAFDILQRLHKVIKDFCGVFTEESLRKNFVLAYEIIDEMIDYGYPQSMSTEQVRPYTVNSAIQVENTGSSFFRPRIMSPNTVPPTAIKRSITGNNKNEIYVDLFEKISVLFNSSGHVVNSSIEGCIQMKSYLVGNPQLRLALNDDLAIGRSRTSSGSVVLDDCNFTDCVNLSEFDDFRILTIQPPDGEFVVMNYRIRGEYDVPFRIATFIDDVTQYRIQMQIKVKATFADTQYGANVIVKCNVPHSTTSVGIELPRKTVGHTAEYKDQEKCVEWTIKKFTGGTEFGINLGISLNSPTSTHEIGPVSMDFEIPMYNCSNLQVKYLRIADQQSKSNQINRWVRYVTQASSYVSRV